MNPLRTLAKQAAKFVAKELTVAACAEVGKHVGDAVGKILSRRIDPVPVKNAAQEKAE